MIPHFISEGPALLVEGDMRVLVIADLHFGAEMEFARSGVHIRSNSRTRMERVLSCIEKTDPDLLLLLGDVKHSIPMTNRQEYAELPSILDEFRAHARMQILPGNHDVGLEKFLEDGELLPKGGVVIDGVGYLHGHTYPAPELFGHLIVAGHHHPVVHLYDEVGCALRARPAYVLGELDSGCPGVKAPDGTPPTRLLFVPAFFELAGGLDVRELKESKLSPFSRCLREEGAEVFLSDGTYVNSLKALRASGCPESP